MNGTKLKTLTGLVLAAPLAVQVLLLGRDEPAAKPVPPVIPNTPAAKDEKPKGATASGRALTEPNGKPVAGQEVMLWNGSAGRRNTTRTDDKGNDAFKAVKPCDHYRVWLVRGETEAHLWSEWGAVPAVADQPVTAADCSRKRPSPRTTISRAPPRTRSSASRPRNGPRARLCWLGEPAT